MCVGEDALAHPTVQELRAAASDRVEQTAAIRDAASWFDRLWSNEPGATFSVDYEAYADDSLRKRFEYQVEERTGMSTF